MDRKDIMVLNLSEGFDPIPIVQPHDSYIKYEAMTFAGGEPHIKLDVSTVRSPDSITVIVTHRINSFNDFGLLLVAIDALRGIGVKDIRAFIPYFPAARQDRRMVSGEPLTVKVYADILNSLSLNAVTIIDPHSDVTPALLYNYRALNNHGVVYNVLRHMIDNGLRTGGVINLAVPDAGAKKKATKLAQYLTKLRYDVNIIQCDKERDTSTGKLTGFRVYDDPRYAPTLIVDDICDGGGTFIGLAEELKKKGAKDLYLVVTHGIFSHGFKELRKHFKGIYTTDSIASDYAEERPDQEKGSEIVTVIKLKDLLWGEF